MKPIRLVALLSLFALLSACNFSLAADVTPPPGYQPPPEEQTPLQETSSLLYPLVPPDPAKGQAIYLEKCAPCHGENGLGDGPRAAQLSNPVTALGASEVGRQAIPARWFSVVTEGNLERFMPPFPSLTDRQRWDVVAYALGLSASPDSLAHGELLYQDNCAACHGERGEGDGPQANGLSLPDFTDQEYMAGESAQDFFAAITNGASGGMPAFSQLAEADRWAMADYLRSLSFNMAATEAASQGTPTPVGETPEAQITSAAPLTTTLALTETDNLGTVSGLVMNASGGEVPAGAEVNLHGFDQMQVVITGTTTLQEDGSFAFENIAMPAGRAFLATLEHQGIIYGSEVMQAEQGTTSIELPVQIYDTTTDTSELLVDRLHLFFEFIDEQTLRVVELYVISNPGPNTLVAAAEGQPVLEFQLPPGAENLEFQDGQLGDRFVKTETGFGDTLPVRPGSGNYQVLFSYTMPFSRKLDLSRPTDLPINAVVALVPEGSIKIKSETLQDSGTNDVQGVAYRVYTGGSLPLGDELRMTITGSPASGNPILAAGSTTSLLVGVGVLGIVLVLTGFWLYSRNRPREESTEQAQLGPARPDADDTESLMDAILALDDLYQQGELPEEAYVQRRSELKERLRGVLGS